MPKSVFLAGSYMVSSYYSYLIIIIIMIMIMDQSTRKLMTMHKALHPRDDVDRLYVSRKEAERGLASIEDSVDAFSNIRFSSRCDSRTT